MKAEIVTIGDEILIGQTVDTNSAWLAENLHLIGIGINRITSISDARLAIMESLDECFSRVDLILMTGGLGPTQDDITKETLAEYFDTVLERNEEVLEGISEYFSAKGLEMLESNRKQADLPRNAKILKNTRGTAQGMWFERNGKVLISMPGVPYEMKGIMSDHGFEELQSFFSTQKIIHKTVLTQGIGESFLAEQIADWEKSLRNDGFALAYLPSPGLVKLRITGYARNGDEVSAESEIDRYIKELERRIPQYAFGRDKDSLAGVIQQLMLNRGLTLSTAESCTGGVIAHMITSEPGSSGYFQGSVVSYSNQAKIDLLGVSEDAIVTHGAVSEPVVREMAQGARHRFHTDYAISTSGVAGPDGGSKEKPVGTVWMAIAGPKRTIAKRFNFGRSRDRNITISALTLLNWLRNEIISGSLE